MAGRKVPVEALQQSCGTGYPGPFGPDFETALKEQDPAGLVPRPEHATFGLAILGGGRVTGTAHLYGENSLGSHIAVVEGRP